MPLTNLEPLVPRVDVGKVPDHNYSVLLVVDGRFEIVRHPAVLVVRTRKLHQLLAVLVLAVDLN